MNVIKDGRSCSDVPEHQEKLAGSAGRCPGEPGNSFLDMHLTVELQKQEEHQRPSSPGPAGWVRLLHGPSQMSPKHLKERLCPPSPEAAPDPSGGPAVRERHPAELPSGSSPPAPSTHAGPGAAWSRSKPLSRGGSSAVQQPLFGSSCSGLNASPAVSSWSPFSGQVPVHLYPSPRSEAPGNESNGRVYAVHLSYEISPAAGITAMRRTHGVQRS
ncbi:uncharacterized protein LOC117197385 [Orcinus orca]|uniref:uncharacterized protein LOC117197385 n=1 Tax=Orcinus orca TaxID=9733 RepID=UPI0021132C55|nr:uncharacterized protein LOC117197385 [Orcinus orca]